MAACSDLMYLLCGLSPQEYNNNKRRSRDIETETDDDLLVCAVWPGPEEPPTKKDSRIRRGSRDSLSGSISSSLSVHSDKNIGSDTVEEFVGDAPFAGLLKGSTAQTQLEAGHRTAAERPKTLRRLKNVYEVEMVTAPQVTTQHPPATTPTSVATQPSPARPAPVATPTSSATSAASPGHQADAITNNGAVATSGQDKSVSMLSPFDEQEEWNKISEIMASFGTGLVRESVFVSEMEQEFQQRLGLSRSPSSASGVANNTSTSSEHPASTPIVCSTVGQWLKSLSLSDLETVFLENGYDDVDFLNGVLEDQDLREIGIAGDKERDAILEAAQALPNLVKTIAQQQQLQRGAAAHQFNGVDVDADPSSSSTVPDDNSSEAVDQWLRKIRLFDEYSETFRKHRYTDMDRVRRVWEVELTAVLEIGKVGHRRRMLASLSGARRQLRTGSLCPDVAAAGNKIRSTSSLSLASPATHHPTLNLEEISADLNQLKTNIDHLKDEIRDKMPPNSPRLSTPSAPTAPDNALTQAPPPPPPSTSNTLPAPSTGTLRHSHKKNRPAPPPPIPVPPQDLEIRDPSSLLMGVPATLTTTWRHKPDALLTGNVSYLANYLGSTVVKELRGTESTQKSIQKLKKPPGTPKNTPDIVLSISYRGVRFLKPTTEELVCEHAIKNIHCACQDADDLTHFAYITKDNLSSDHFCHVFCVLTMEQATEVIMTLGQAFEVAYQMALKDQGRATNGHTRSQSAAGPMTATISTSVSSGPLQIPAGHSHSRSLSDVKVNGQERQHPPPHTPPPSAMPPPTLMLTEDILGLG